MIQDDMDNLSRYAEAGAFLKAARNAKGLTLEDVVDALKKLGVPSSKSVIHRMEKGEQMASNLGDAQFVRALTQVLGVSSAELMALTGHIPFRELRFGAEKQHLAELLAVMDDDTLAAAEQVLEVLVAQQKKANQS